MATDASPAGRQRGLGPVADGPAPDGSPADGSPDDGPLATSVHVDEFRAIGVTAFTTTRVAGNFGLGGREPVEAVMSRWSALMDDCRRIGAPALATSGQIHGAEIEIHTAGWRGWLRGMDRDGHVTCSAGVALAVTVADCTPVFLAHPNGALAMLHAGWRGTAAGILERGIAALGTLGAPAGELLVHFGPAICGACYEVGSEVIAAVRGDTVTSKQRLDVRATLAERAEQAGCRNITISSWCTRCHVARFFSHRGGDTGRQLGVLLRSS